MDVTTKQINLLKIWDKVDESLSKWARENKFKYVGPLPFLMSSAGACENFNAVFKILGSEEYYGEQAFLVQSLQLLLEMFTEKMGGRVFTEIRSFRKEMDVDSRHLSEFPLFEIEQNGNFEDLIETVDKLIRFTCQEVAIHCKEELKYFGKDWKQLLDLSVKRITYTQAIEILKHNKFDIVWGDDLKAEHELFLVNNLGELVFITHFPKPIKFWNMEDNKEDSNIVNSFDVIGKKSGELCGAAQRQTEYDLLNSKLIEHSSYKMMRELGVPHEAFLWYLDHHKDKVVKSHGGFGLGVARLVQFILGQDDIRDCLPIVLNKDNLL